VRDVSVNNDEVLLGKLEAVVRFELADLATS
jgi:hypothetical protein